MKLDQDLTQVLSPVKGADLGTPSDHEIERVHHDLGIVKSTKRMVKRAQWRSIGLK